MRWTSAVVVAVMLGAFAASSLQADHKRGGNLYRGGIAWNDYGHGPTGGYRAAVRNNRLAANNWSGLGGYSSYRPYYNNWSGNVSIGFGRPFGYSSFNYYSGPVLGGYGYSPYYDYGYYGDYYGTYYSPRANSLDYYFPPVYAPAELAYGPQAMNQFLGVDRRFALGALANPQPQVIEREVVREVAKPAVKEVDWEARKKADRFIELGDQNFQKQKFHDALLRYRLAVQAAPDYAVAHLRHGFSLVAGRRYEEAATAFTKAFTLEPEIIKSGFRLDQLYADNRLAREAHQESLAQAALDAPEKGNLHFVVGMWLLFNGEIDRSRKFFEEARALGVDAALVSQPDEGGRDL